MEHGMHAKLGSGERFAALVEKIRGRGKARNPAAIAASVGRKKYGKKRFQKLAAAGRKSSRHPMMEEARMRHG